MSISKDNRRKATSISKSFLSTVKNVSGRHYEGRTSYKKMRNLVFQSRGQKLPPKSSHGESPAPSKPMDTSVPTCQKHFFLPVNSTN